MVFDATEWMIVIFVKEKKKKRIRLGGNIKLSLGIQLALKQCQG